MKMLAEERRILLLEWSQDEGRIDAVDAAARLSVAIETVRRDLDTLQRRGLLRRVHGGAIALGRMPHESGWAERQSTNAEAKSRIAAQAALQLPEAGAVFVDGGTTTQLLAEHLRFKPDLLLITNSIPLGNLVADSGTPVHLLSGRLRATTLSALGSRTVADIAGFRAQMVFLGANGVDPAFGFTTSDPEEAAVKRAFIEHAREKVVLADSGKFGRVFPAAFALPKDIDRLITDGDAPRSAVDALTSAGVEVVTV